MKKEMKFIMDMKVLLLSFEYEEDKGTKMDTVDQMRIRVRDFAKEFCE